MAKLKNKFVITGPPSSGKTTVLKILRDSGIRVISDTSREVMQEINLSDIDINSIVFSDLIFKAQLAKENSIDNDELYFLDMSLIECLVFRKLKNQSISILSSVELKNRYEMVFLFHPLPFEFDGYRDEKDAAQTETIFNSMKDTYSNLGYEVIEIPKLSAEKRAQLVLKTLRKRGLTI